MPVSFYDQSLMLTISLLSTHRDSINKVCGKLSNSVLTPINRRKNETKQNKQKS